MLSMACSLPKLAMPMVLQMFILTIVSTRSNLEGVTFQIANSSHYDQVHQLLEEDFFPDEPFARSLGSSPDKYYVVWLWIELSLRSRESVVVALDKAGDVIGVNLGTDMPEAVHDDRSVSLGDWYYQTQMWLLMHLHNLLGPLTPSYLGQDSCHAVFEKAVEILGYHPDKLMAALNCKKLYTVELLGVSRKARGKGLGTQLVREGEKLARARGCECARVSATSIYSARIFRKLGWAETGRILYEEFTNQDGEVLVKNTGEHTEWVTFSKEL